MVTVSKTSTTTIELGFQPKYIAIWNLTNGSYSNADMSIYSVDAGKAAYAASDSYMSLYNLPSSARYRIASITSTGFVLNDFGYDKYLEVAYFAVG